MSIVQKSHREREVTAAESHAAAHWELARRPTPYADNPDYMEGRLDYFEGVCYRAYASIHNRYWRMGWLEAHADYPEFERVEE